MFCRKCGIEMDLIKNNIKAIMIHLLSIPFFLIGLFLYVVASPLYKSEAAAIMIAIISYVAFYTGYFALLVKFLQSSKFKIYNAFSGVLVAVVSLVIWRLTYISNQSVVGIEAYTEIWIPYNLYNFMLWPMTYAIENHNVMWIFSVLNSLFAPLAIVIQQVRHRGGV